MDPPSPTRLLFQGAHLTHIPKLLDRRQEGGEWSKGNRGHWKVRRGHKGSWGVGEGRWTSVPGLMAQRTSIARDARGVLGARGRGGQSVGALGVAGEGGGWSSRRPANKPSAPTVPLLTGPKRANQKLLQGRLSSSLQTGQDRGLGSSHSLQDPSANGFRPSGGLNTTSQGRSRRDPSLLTHPLWAPCPHLSHGPIPLASTFGNHFPNKPLVFTSSFQGLQ